MARDSSCLSAKLVCRTQRAIWYNAFVSESAAHPEAVENWLAVKPKAWGFLAGKGIIAARDRLGRTLTEPERLAVWNSLWQGLEILRSSQR